MRDASVGGVVPTCSSHARDGASGKLVAMFARRFQSWLFVLFLLWGQASAFAHALEHVGETVAHAPCELCVGQASLGGSAPPSQAFVLPPSAAGTATPVAVAAVVPHRAALRPRARAPPSAPFV